MPVVLRLLLAAIAGVMSSARFGDIAEALHSILHATSAAGVQWLQEALALVPAHSATESDKDVFFRCLAQSSTATPGSAQELEQVHWCVRLPLYPVGELMFGLFFFTCLC